MKTAHGRPQGMATLKTSTAIRTPMTFQAPLTQQLKPTRRRTRVITPKPIKSLLGVVVAAALTTACATKQPDASLADDNYWQNIQSAEMEVINGANIGNPVIEAASFGSSTPALALGMSPKRKIALRALAENSVRNDNPGNYTVVPGDTLWDISERFLSRPWLWPEIWHVNPQIDNPHLIYPGDQIGLTYIDGRPRLQLIRASSKDSNVPINGFPLQAIRQFLVEPQVITKNELNTSPYVISAEDDRLIASAGNHIYVRGQIDGTRYSVYRPGEALVDPDTREVLGHEAIHVSKASLVKSGDPSKLILTSNKRETLVGDRLLPSGNALPASFQPRTADAGKSGKIISLVDAVTRSGQNQVVVLNLGESDGIQAGDVMSVISDDRQVKDLISGKKNDFVTIEGDQSGVVMVFRTFDRVSYALVMKAHRSINLYDRVGTSEL